MKRRLIFFLLIVTFFNVIIMAYIYLFDVNIQSETSFSKRLNSKDLLYEWDTLKNIYGNITEDSLIKNLNNYPYSIRDIIIPGDMDLLGITEPLYNMVEDGEDTLLFKEYMWIQGHYLNFVWFKEDSTGWHVVDALKYDPALVQF